MNQERKQQVIALLRSTKRQGIEDVITYMEESGFFSARGGGHHKYPGGLLDHSWEVYEFMKDSAFLRGVSEDSIIITGLLHDLGKAKMPGMYFCKGHDKRSLAILEHFGVSLSQAEKTAVLHHQHSLQNYLCPLRIVLSLGDCKSTGDWKKAHQNNKQ